MRDYAVPQIVNMPDDHNATFPVWDNADNHPDAVLFAVPEDGDWRDVTAAEFRAQVVAVARGLVVNGIQPGQRVGLMSRTRYEWTLFDYAIWTAGAVTVPVYETSSAEQAKWILTDSEAVACVVESATHTDTIDSIRADLPKLSHLWTIEADAVNMLTQQGADSDVDIEQCRTSAKADDLATIVYTSGTTGRPKGCELTHRNLVEDIDNTLPRLSGILAAEASTLMFLPLAHVFARIMQLGTIHARVRVGHVPDPKAVVAQMPHFKPDFIVAVPRVFEKIYNGAEQKAIESGKAQAKIFAMAANTAIEYSKSLDQGGPGPLLRAKHKVFDRLVYAKLRALMGDNCSQCISGGAPLGERLAHFFRGVGVIIYEGYGLTETSPVIAVNGKTEYKLGTVGKPIAGTHARLSDTGELLIKGPQVFRGYWGNETATTHIRDEDGWFATGDLADIDDEGFIRITGRCKEIIVTAGGKNVAPAPLEDAVRAHPLVGQCLVVGDGKPFIAALVSLDPEALPGWLERNNRPADTPVSELREDPEILAEVDKAITEANTLVSRAEAIKTFRVLPATLGEETGEVTPKQSVKRNVVLEKFASDFEAIYTT